MATKEIVIKFGQSNYNIKIITLCIGNWYKYRKISEIISYFVSSDFNIIIGMLDASCERQSFIYSNIKNEQFMTIFDNLYYDI